MYCARCSLRHTRGCDCTGKVHAACQHSSRGCSSTTRPELHKLRRYTERYTAARLGGTSTQGVAQKKASCKQQPRERDTCFLTQGASRQGLLFLRDTHTHSICSGCSCAGSATPAQQHLHTRACRGAMRLHSGQCYNMDGQRCWCWSCLAAPCVYERAPC